MTETALRYVEGSTGDILAEVRLLTQLTGVKKTPRGLLYQAIRYSIGGMMSTQSMEETTRNVGQVAGLPDRESEIADDQWFWTEEWQEGEKVASRELRERMGFGPFKSGQEMRTHFEEWKKGQKTTPTGP
jgi:hypothetical protein